MSTTNPRAVAMAIDAMRAALSGDPDRDLPEGTDPVAMRAALANPGRWLEWVRLASRYGTEEQAATLDGWDDQDLLAGWRLLAALEA